MEGITKKWISWDKYTGDSPPKQTDSNVPDHPKLLQFETERSHYHFHPGVHRETTELPTEVIRSVDAIVVEEAISPPGKVSLDEFFQHTQFKAVLQTNVQYNRRPVYRLDLPNEDDIPLTEAGKKIVNQTWGVAIGFAILAVVISVVFFPAGLLSLFLTGPLIFVITSIAMEDILGWHGYRYRVKRLLSYLTVPLGVTLVGARSAVVAHKLEQFVAPKRASEIEAKPDILIDYGSAHADMRLYLQHPLLRRMVMKLHEYRGYGFKNKEYTDRIIEYSFGNIDSMYANEFTLRDVKDQIRYKKLVFLLDQPWPGLGTETD